METREASRKMTGTDGIASEKKYAKLVMAIIKNPGVVQPFGKKGFGRNGLYFGGRLFAFLFYKKQLVLKLEPERVKDLVAEGDGIHWDPRHDGRVFKHWVMLKPSSKKDWLPLAREALKLAKASSKIPQNRKSDEGTKSREIQYHQG